MAKIEKVDLKAVLSDASPEKVFWARNGETYRNLSEMVGGLRRMDGASFSHHVTKEKNDFANWARDVFADKSLEKQMRSAKLPRDMAKKVSERLKQMRGAASRKA